LLIGDDELMCGLICHFLWKKEFRFEVDAGGFFVLNEKEELAFNPGHPGFEVFEDVSNLGRSGNGTGVLVMEFEKTWARAADKKRGLIYCGN
jgi:hypothetical protein